MVLRLPALPADSCNQPAPFSGRRPRAPLGPLCATTLEATPWITELLTSYDDASRTLRCEAQSLPGFVILSRNTWSVTPIDTEHSRLALSVELKTRGVLGGAARRLMLLEVRKIVRQSCTTCSTTSCSGPHSPQRLPASGLVKMI